MWSEKRQEHIRVLCAACGNKVDAEYSDKEELEIEVDPCDVCLHKAEESARFDEGRSSKEDD